VYNSLLNYWNISSLALIIYPQVFPLLFLNDLTGQSYLLRYLQNIKKEEGLLKSSNQRFRELIRIHTITSDMKIR
jgi:hypothetical protein